MFRVKIGSLLSVLTVHIYTCHKRISLILLLEEKGLKFDYKTLTFYCLARGGSDTGPRVPQVVSGGHYPALHRAPRLILPQYHSPHEKGCPCQSD